MKLIKFIKLILLLLTQEILDSCIQAERQGNTLSVTLTYPFLSPPQQPKEADSEKGEGSKEEMAMKNTKGEEAKEEPAENLPETNPLLFMIESAEHDHLLEHPIVNSFLRLKFASIAPFYMLKTIFYAIFVAFINAYVFLLNQHIMEEGVPEETRKYLQDWIKRIAAPTPAALQADVRLYCTKELQTKKQGKTMVRFQVTLGESWDVFDPEFGIDRMMTHILKVMETEGAERKFGSAPRGPLEREASRLLEKLG